MGGYSVLVNYQSFLSNLFSLAPQLFFSINCIRNWLLCVSFIELFDFIIYQHLNKRTNILPLASSQIAHLCHQFNHVCTANFNATFWKHYFWIKIALKWSYFCKTNAKILSAARPPCLRQLGALPPNPQPPAAAGFAPRPPKQPPHCEFLATRLIWRT